MDVFIKIAALCLAVVVLAAVDDSQPNELEEFWQMLSDFTGFGSSSYSSNTGVSDNETPLPDDDCGTQITSKSCQNFAEERENAINLQINEELNASYVYMAMSAYFNRDDPNLKGFSKFFAAASTEERDHALKFVDYQNMRGGQVRFTALQAPEQLTWTSGLAAMTDALNLEKHVNDKLLKLHRLSDSDPHLQDFLETHYLPEQVDSIRELAGYVTQLTRLRETNPGLGEHIFDKELLG